MAMQSRSDESVTITRSLLYLTNAFAVFIGGFDGSFFFVFDVKTFHSLQLSCRLAVLLVFVIC